MSFNGNNENKKPPKLDRGLDSKYRKKINYVFETISYSYKYCKFTTKEIL